MDKQIIKLRWLDLVTQVELPNHTRLTEILELQNLGRYPLSCTIPIPELLTWTCPCCKREPIQIIRWTKAVTDSIVPKSTMYWRFSIHKHHDHSGFDRFPVTPICADCNQIEGAIKRRNNKSRHFSYSAEEVSKMITPTKNLGVNILNSSHT